MGALLIVVDEPEVEIGLQLLDRQIDLLAERNSVELVQDSTMESLANAVGLRALGLGAAVIDVFDREVELVFRGFPGRRTRCRDRSTPGIAGCRARRRAAPLGR